MTNTERLRVLMLCGQLGAGGAPKVVLNVTKHLLRSVDEVAIGYFGGRDELVPEFTELGVSVVRLGDGTGYSGVLSSLWRLISAYRPTVIHTHMVSAHSWGRVFGRLRGIPVVSTIHTTYTNRSVAARALDLSTSSFASVNVAVSNAVAASLPLYFGLGARSAIVHNCIDPEDLRSKGEVSWNDAEWNTDLLRNQPIIANVTRFDPKKRKEDLIRALPEILEEFPHTAVVLTGWGGHRRHVENVARSLGVEEHTYFVGNVSNPYSVYRHADIVALPSVSEGFSIGVLEAMAFAKPIVATDIPPFREALGAEYPLVPTRDPAALAEEIRRYLRNPKRAETAGAEARERVERMFSGQSAAESYLSIYEATNL